MSDQPLPFPITDVFVPTWPVKAKIAKVLSPASRIVVYIDPKIKCPLTLSFKATLVMS